MRKPPTYRFIFITTQPWFAYSAPKLVEIVGKRLNYPMKLVLLLYIHLNLGNRLRKSLEIFIFRAVLSIIYAIDSSSAAMLNQDLGLASYDYLPIQLVGIYII